ncbi:hypothetical protein PGT21_021922 [Puccinia graminis f. sp. tritici]|uniref:Uncharacterized protein n=1 Tax=Puccinia graminis f. sp. tritici TaxID=56615 RepID=A0A5B0PQK1_PUCGR|nr:hypothetical protein PGT21_021922 [Puccinia graminis f. sp. tritici]
MKLFQLEVESYEALGPGALMKPEEEQRVDLDVKPFSSRSPVLVDGYGTIDLKLNRFQLELEVCGGGVDLEVKEIQLEVPCDSRDGPPAESLSV